MHNLPPEDLKINSLSGFDPKEVLRLGSELQASSIRAF
jgi:hypothetical protein